MKMTKRVFITAVILLVVFFSYATYWAVKNLTLPGASSGENTTAVPPRNKAGSW